jgi:hypothetical protein
MSTDLTFDSDVANKGATAFAEKRTLSFQER